MIRFDISMNRAYCKKIAKQLQKLLIINEFHNLIYIIYIDYDAQLQLIKSIQNFVKSKI